MISHVTAVHVAVRDALADLRAGDVVLVACSGGPDSLALAAATANLAAQHGWPAGAVVIDHGWSAAARTAAGQAAATCRELGLRPVDLLAVDCSGPGGPEAAARTARYQALDDAAQRHRAQAVLLGHTLDDQAESVLLGLGRGSGARSLAGMAARRGVYRRPFLGLGRDSTLAACAGLGLTPWLDPANDDPAYTRVRIRNLAGQLEQALGPGAAQALARTADLLRDDADALEAAAAQLLATALDQDDDLNGDLNDDQDDDLNGDQDDDLNHDQDDDLNGDLNVAVLAAAMPALRRRALLAAARSAGCPAGSLSHRHAVALDHLLNSGTGARSSLPGGVVAQIVQIADGQLRVRFAAPPGYGKLAAVTGS